jgi:hypothetical protein
MNGKVAKIVKNNQSRTVNKKPSLTLMPSYFFSKLTKYRNEPNARVIRKEYAKATILSSL